MIDTKKLIEAAEHHIKRGDSMAMDPRVVKELAQVALSHRDKQAEPLFWYRPRSDGGYEGPIDNSSIEEVRKKSGAWVGLHPEAPAVKESLITEQVQEPVACLVGMKGSAFDTPKTKRAYTYAEQPGNTVAWKLGKAKCEAQKSVGGDYIDAGLGLLKALQNEGFGVFDLGAEYTHPQPAPDVRELVDALNKIANWNEHTLDFALDQGSTGVRDFYRKIAIDALAKHGVQP